MDYDDVLSASYTPYEHSEYASVMVYRQDQLYSYTSKHEAWRKGFDPVYES